MSDHTLDHLEKRARELRQGLRNITVLERQGHDESKRRITLASKLRHVENAIFRARQQPLPLKR